MQRETILVPEPTFFNPKSVAFHTQASYFIKQLYVMDSQTNLINLTESLDLGASPFEARPRRADVSMLTSKSDPYKFQTIAKNS